MGVGKGEKRERERERERERQRVDKLFIFNNVRIPLQKCITIS